MLFDNGIDPELADLCEPIAQPPSTSGFVALDQAFVSADLLLEDESPVLSKRASSDMRDGKGRRWMQAERRWSEPGL